jgi:hypothetical protein
LCPAGVSKNIVKPVLSDGQLGTTNSPIDSEDSRGRPKRRDRAHHGCKRIRS